MHEQLWLTAILNHLLASPVLGLLQVLHIKPKYPDAPIPNSVAMELLVFFFLVLLLLQHLHRLMEDHQQPICFLGLFLCPCLSLGPYTLGYPPRPQASLTWMCL